MKKLTSFIILIIFLGFQSLFGQSAGNVIYNNPDLAYPQRVGTNVNLSYDNNLVLQAEVMINVKATSYTVIFSITQNGKTASQTDSLMNLRLTTVKQALRQMNIKESNFHVDVISLVPIYSLKLEEKKFSKTANEVPTGFQLKKNVHILFYDHDQLSEIVALMAKAEIYDIVKVDYNLDDIQSAYDTLRKTAAQIIKMKEKEYPKMGLHLEIQNMSDGYNVAYPLERYASYTAYYTGSSVEEVRVAKKKKEQAKNVYISGRNQTINIQTPNKGDDDSEFIIKQADKSKTIYYNKIPYNQFDKVINADCAEPRIQFFYTLKVRYAVVNQEKYNEIKKDQKEKKSAGWFKKRQKNA